jgi:hypothetical protein
MMYSWLHIKGQRQPTNSVAFEIKDLEGVSFSTDIIFGWTSYYRQYSYEARSTSK